MTLTAGRLFPPDMLLSHAALHAQPLGLAVLPLPDATASPREIAVARGQIQAADTAMLGCDGLALPEWAHAPGEMVARWRATLDDLPLERLWLDCTQPSAPTARGDWLEDLWLQAAAEWTLGIRTTRGWWASYAGGDARFGGMPLWDVDATGRPGAALPVPYGGWTQRTVHEYAPGQLYLADRADGRL
jgi:hypothetical protein